MSENRPPEIVCLCGSTRFYDVFQRENYEQTMAGRIVLTVGFFWSESPERPQPMSKRTVAMLSILTALDSLGGIGTYRQIRQTAVFPDVHELPTSTLMSRLKDALAYLRAKDFVLISGGPVRSYRITDAGRDFLDANARPQKHDAHGESIGCTPEQKKALDELHLWKIRLAHVVRILNVGGYIGASTLRELAFAVSLGKRIEFLEESGDLRAFAQHMEEFRGGGPLYQP